MHTRDQDDEQVQMVDVADFDLCVNLPENSANDDIQSLIFLQLVGVVFRAFKYGIVS